MPQADEPVTSLFVERYHALVRYVHRRVDDHELAEDIAAEAFARAWTQHQTGTQISVTWLVSTARNLIGNYYQHRLSERAQIKLLIAEAVQEQMHDEDFRPAEVSHAMTRLRASDALVLHLTYWEGLSAGEIAERLGCSVPACWARVARARRALRLLLEPPEFRYPEPPDSRGSRRSLA